MSIVLTFVERILSVFRKDRYLEELREEMDFHVATRAEKYAAAGMSGSEALRTAQKEFGRCGFVRHPLAQPTDPARMAHRSDHCPAL